MRPTKGTLAVLALLALLAGCGSYTKRDFTAGADAICASTVRATRNIAAPASSQSPVRQLRALAGYLTKVVPLLESESKQIHALKQPSESAHDGQLRTRYLVALSQSVTRYQELAAAARAGDAHAVARAEAALAASPVTSLAARYGLGACAAPGATVS